MDSTTSAETPKRRLLQARGQIPAISLRVESNARIGSKQAKRAGTILAANEVGN